jgi:hypothetical protein
LCFDLLKQAYRPIRCVKVLAGRLCSGDRSKIRSCGLPGKTHQGTDISRLFPNGSHPARFEEGEPHLSHPSFAWLGTISPGGGSVRFKTPPHILPIGHVILSTLADVRMLEQQLCFVALLTDSKE